MSMIEGVAGSRSIKPVLDPSVRLLCCRPYPGHRKGCPNHGNHSYCPPTAPMLSEIFDLSKPVWAIYVEYDLQSHRERMLQKHPQWSKRQTECCLYWQSKVLSFLKNKVANFCTITVLSYPKIKQIALYRPEANGVNVTATMADVGIELQWPPESVVYKIAFVGHVLKGTE